LIAVQLSRTPGKHPWFAEPVGFVGITLVALGGVLFIVRGLMIGKDKKVEPEPAVTEGDQGRTGYRVRGRGKVWSRNAKIRNQDIAVDVDDDGDFRDEGTDIG
jgi:hypothetical protein